ncbi:unnamed protein product [Clonostachys rhizophaga]|uniref:Uncharacterized protein n=1 Tax=Clonostachys rhizophaga TaxID=160324 RepID=A0A9N9VR60_9HYPO|nr:unnamed protein product [Clonostachys rhizophaga]
MFFLLNMGHGLTAVILTSVVITATYLYIKLSEKRLKQYAHLPQAKASLLWGHLKLFDEYTKRGNHDRHPDAIMAEIHKDIGSPPFFMLDMRPINPPTVVIANYELAEQLSRPSKGFPYSVHKAPTTVRMIPLIGSKAIFFHQNESWKGVRKRFNQGFAPAHLMTLLPGILEKTVPFLNHLDERARIGQPFRLSDLTTNLTFDIIGTVAMDVDMEAQKGDASQQGEFVRRFKELIKTYADDKLFLPWWLIPLTEIKRLRLSVFINRRLREIVDEKLKTLHSAPLTGRSRTILTLALQDVEHITPEILEEAYDQLKAFLLAGHDTTSVLIDWSIYELSRTPHALKAVQEEVKTLFGSDAYDPRAICARLSSSGGAELVHQMTYISAVIRETLRLHPPAGSVRMTMPNSGSTCIVSTPQGEYCLDGTWMYINHTIIHRDRAVFGETAEEFRPERWLVGGGTKGTGDDESLFMASSGSFPPGAWRPFERGPRNCIGQELANIEARIAITILAHKYKFSKVGLGESDLDEKGQPMFDNKGQYKTKSELYSTFQISARPVDGMIMKVELAESSLETSV